MENDIQLEMKNSKRLFQCYLSLFIAFFVIAMNRVPVSLTVKILFASLIILFAVKSVKANLALCSTSIASDFFFGFSHIITLKLKQSITF